MDGPPAKMATMTSKLMLRVSKPGTSQRSHILFKEPIEQNVNGQKGLYELVYFVKDSKSLQRFKVQAQQFDQYTKSKSDAAIENLVSFWLTEYDYSFGKR